ncbi:hypothetical protein CR513_38631, partial [Mucuna pruriens]
MLLLQEFDVEIKGKKDAKNAVTDHLSRLEREVDPLLNHVTTEPYIYNFLVTSTFPLGASRTYKDKLGSEAMYYIWNYPYLWRICNYQSVLHFCHAVVRGGHYRSGWTAPKVFDCGLYWPTIFRDAHVFVMAWE